MFCPNCGAPISNDSAACPYCTTSRQATPQTTFNSQPVAAPAVADQPSMTWFKFLIYFGLFMSALSNTVSGFKMMTGSVYGSEKELIYDFIDGLQPLDMAIGVIMIALAVLAIYTRFRLAGYHQNGPTMLMLTYAGAIAVNMIYFIGINVILSEMLKDAVDTSSLISSSIISAIMLFVNHTYFKKRASLFVNP